MRTQSKEKEKKVVTGFLAKKRSDEICINTSSIFMRGLPIIFWDLATLVLHLPTDFFSFTLKKYYILKNPFSKYELLYEGCL